jgi:hypothetical protein
LSLRLLLLSSRELLSLRLLLLSATKLAALYASTKLTRSSS